MIHLGAGVFVTGSLLWDGMNDEGEGEVNISGYSKAI
jgi:hypothetical protein